jgi:hypothetical protein
MALSSGKNGNMVNPPTRGRPLADGIHSQFPGKGSAEVSGVKSPIQSAENAHVNDKEKQMNPNRKAAIIVGVLFIIGTVAGILSGVVTGPFLTGQDYLLQINENQNRLVAGALLVLLMGLALALVPIVMFPIFKKTNETLAVGYVVFRGALETVCYLPWVIGWLVLGTLSLEFVKAGSPNASYFQTLGALIQGLMDWSGLVSYIIFSLGALMFYFLFYQSKLIPRWLSVWGLVGAGLFLAEPILAMFGAKIEILFALLAVQEMVLAVWLIVKGFDPVGMSKAEPA